jgi:hypothetical protein
MLEESISELIHTLTDFFGNSIPQILLFIAVIGQTKSKSFIFQQFCYEFLIGIVQKLVCFFKGLTAQAV